MKITNQEVALLYKWLNVPLHGEECRTRNRFVWFISEQHKANETKRVQLLEAAAEKDETGKPKVKDNGEYDIASEKYEEFAKAFNTYLLEEAPIPEIDAKLWKAVGRLLVKDVVAPKLGIEYGRFYDELLTKIESL